jgi:hypothetical protein
VRRRDGQYRWLLHKAKLLSDRICVHRTLEVPFNVPTPVFMLVLNVRVRRVLLSALARAMPTALSTSWSGALSYHRFSPGPALLLPGHGHKQVMRSARTLQPIHLQGRQRTASAELLNHRWGSGLGGPRECLLSRVESRRGTVLGEFLYRHGPARARQRGTEVHPAQAHAQSQESKLKTTADREVTCLRQSVHPALTRVSVATFYPEGAVKPGS